MPDLLRDREPDRGGRRANASGTQHPRRRRRFLAARRRERRGRQLAQGAAAKHRLQGLSRAPCRDSGSGTCADAETGYPPFPGDEMPRPTLRERASSQRDVTMLDR
ncbi:protein of unknown function [Burkholderia multivorans]